jgi:hypothetical protein
VRVVRCVLCFFVGHAKGKGHVIAIRIRQNPIAITNILVSADATENHLVT